MRCGLALLLLVASLAAQTPGLPDQAVWFTDPHADPLPPERDLPGRLADALGAAKESVEASFMRLDAPRVLDALIAAHRRGVVVRVMTDDDMRAHRFAAPFQRLAAAGVSVRTDGGAPWSVNLHHKFCVIDGEWLWNGDWNATVLESRTAHMSAFLLRSRSLAGSFRRQFERLWRGEDAGLGSPASTPGGGGGGGGPPAPPRPGRPPRWPSGGPPEPTSGSLRTWVWWWRRRSCELAARWTWPTPCSLTGGC